MLLWLHCDVLAVFVNVFAVIFRFKHSFVACGNVCDLFFSLSNPVACLLAVLVYSVSLAAAISDSTTATSPSKVRLKWNDLRVSHN